MVVPPSPERSLSRLFAEINRLFSLTFAERIGEDHGLTHIQWQALGGVWRFEGIRQSDLAELLGKKPVAMARLLDRIEAGGWIERRRSTSDRRALHLYLTDKAKPLLGEMSAHAASVHDATFKDFKDSEIDRLFLYLERIKSNLSGLSTDKSSVVDADDES